MAECDAAKTIGAVESVYCGSGVDGKGLRVVVFFGGCNLRCPFCHNPETLYRECGKTTAAAVVDRCLKYRGYIRRGGVTLSGGEPFLQPEFCLAIIRGLKREGVNVAVETNGHIVNSEIIVAADSFIADVKIRFRTIFPLTKGFSASATARVKKSFSVTCSCPKSTIRKKNSPRCAL